MASHSSRPANLVEQLSPFPAALGVVSYLGRLAVMATSAFGALVVPAKVGPSLISQTMVQLDRLLSMGLPLVGLVHVGMGSFLAMQAYFGATFVDGIGPVTGVGLIRNLASLLTGFIMAGLISARYIAELSGPTDPDTSPSRMVAARLVASCVAGPILSVWGALVGIAIGWLVAHQMMGLTLPAFFDMFLEMLWVRDIYGIVIKGAAFGFVTALLACQEGLSRPDREHTPASLEWIGSAACRAACLAGVSILFLNSAWFLLVYHAGPPFGPTVLAPPNE